MNLPEAKCQAILEDRLVEHQTKQVSLPVLGNRLFNKLMEEAIETEVLRGDRLTESLAKINADLWNEAKRFGGTSKGTSWTAETIILGDYQLSAPNIYFTNNPKCVGPC
jgi:hypothetical protein